MYDLEKAIKQWVRTLRRHTSLDDGTIYEMELHLRDHIDHAMESGMTPKEAFEAASNAFGPVEEIAREEQSVHSPHRSGPFSLLRHYTSYLFRMFRRHTSISVIKVVNLSVGIALFLLSVAYIQFEWSYDQFHPDHERIVRLHQTLRNLEWAATPAGVGPYLRDNFSQVEEMVRIDRTQTTVRHGTDIFHEKDMAFVDPAYPRLFHLEFVHGSPASAFSDPSGIVISESTARKYFAKADVVGESLLLEFDRGEPRQITGVYQDMPENSHLDFDILISLEALEPQYTRWANFATYTYLKLSETAALDKLEKQTVEEYRKQYEVGEEEKMDLGFIPIADIHLHSHAEKELSVNSDVSYLYIFGIAAGLILLVSCINFVNLSLVQTHKRTRELGLRKSLGASGRQLTTQLVMETTVLIALSAAIAVLIILIIQPWLESLYEGNLFTFEPVLWIGLPLALIVFLVVVCGIVPALMTSSFRPVSMIRSVTSPGFKLGISRQALILFQFTTALILIMGAMTTYQQMDLLRNRDLGFEKEQRVALPLSYGLNENLAVFKKELKEYPQVLETTHSSSVPGYRIMQERLTPLGREEGHQVRLLLTSAGWIETYGLEMRKGRSFSQADEENGQGYWILNEEAAKLFFPDQEEFLGTQMIWQDTAEVVGVVKNFHFQSLHEPVTPLAIKLAPYARGMLTVSFSAPDRASITEVIRDTFDKVYVNQPEPELIFLDERFEELYAKESTLQLIVFSFTLISLLLTISGIFGISHYAVQQKMREIAIRKVLGGSVKQIIFLISRNMLLLIGVSLLIAIPLAHWLLQEWLDGFAYHIQLNLLLYLAGVIILGITIFGASASTIWSAIHVNPARTLNRDQ